MDNSGYPSSKKARYLKAHERVCKNQYEFDKCTDVKSFIKDEFYEEFKYARTINARDDWFKVYSGPVFHAIEKILFKRPEFVKYVPVAERGKFLRDRLQFCRYFAETDFKSFESSFVREVMEACEFQLYDHMLKKHPLQLSKMLYIKSVLSGKNNMKFKGFKLWVEAVRMSGEMNTSLGNGFSNLMLQKFFSHYNGLNAVEVIEGDDGAIGYYELPPDPVKFFNRLGFTLTYGIKTDLSNVSFCGITCSSDGTHMVDFRKPLLAHCWIKSPYKSANISKILAIVKGKCLSLFDRVPSCPVVSAFNAWVFKLCGKGRSRLAVGSTKYEIQRYLHCRKNISCSPGKISLRTRQEYAVNYGISVSEQLELEALFNKAGNQMVWHPLFVKLFNNDTYLMAKRIVEGNEHVAISMVRTILNDKNKSSETTSKHCSTSNSKASSEAKSNPKNATCDTQGYSCSAYDRILHSAGITKCSGTFIRV